MWVEVDIFSGKKNPIWNLFPGDRDRFLRMLENLKPAADLAIPLSLDYNGITIRGLGENEPKSIHIYRGLVVVRRGNDLDFLFDSGRKLERQVLMTGQDMIEIDLYASLLRSMRCNGLVIEPALDRGKREIDFVP